MLIVFDGIDRAGKTSHLRMITDWLTKENKEFVLKREPGGTDVSEKIRNVFIKNKMHPLSQLMLISASRLELTLELQRIDPRKLILLDRYIDSTYAYQGQDLDDEVIDQFVKMSSKIQPDFVFLFLNTYKSNTLNQMDVMAKKNREGIIERFKERAKLNPEKYFIVQHAHIKKQQEIICKKIEEILGNR